MINKLKLKLKKKLELTIAKTFVCVDCGRPWPIAKATVKIDTIKPKYCKYCFC